MAGKTVTINNKDDAAKAAADYGVVWPSGVRGRKPTTKLYDAIVAAGDTVAGSYCKPSVRTTPVGPGERNYDVSRTVMVERETSKGKRKMPKRETVRVNVGELREILNHHARGKLGHSRIVEALRMLRDKGNSFAGWSDAEIDGANITLVTPKASKPAKGAETAVKPRNARTAGSKPGSKSKPRSKAVSPVVEPAEPETVPA